MTAAIKFLEEGLTDWVLKKPLRYAHPVLQPNLCLLASERKSYTIAELAAHQGVSARYLHRLFTVQLGIGAKRFCQIQRVKKTLRQAQVAEDLAKGSSLQLVTLPGFQQLSTADQAKAAKAVAYYQAHIIDKNLLFNVELATIKNQRSQLPDQVSWEATNFAVPLVVAWEVFDPVYEKNFWPSHKAKNEKVVKQHLGRITSFEGRALARLSQLAQAEWPVAKIRVDVSFYADWAGAYTSTKPLHIVASTAALGPEGDWISI